MRKHVPAEQHRVISKRKKIIVAAVLLLAVLAAVWYKIPYEKACTDTLMWDGEGETPALGTVIDVAVNVRVQRYFFAEPVHVGTVTVGDQEFTNGNTGRFVPTPSLLGAFVNPEVFYLACSEWRGSVLVSTCTAAVENGEVVALSVPDRVNGGSVRYVPLPKNSK